MPGELARNLRELNLVLIDVWVLDRCVNIINAFLFFFFSSRRRHTRFKCDWSSDVCSSDLFSLQPPIPEPSAFALAGVAFLAWCWIRGRCRPVPQPSARRHAAMVVPANLNEIGRASCRERV